MLRGIHARTFGRTRFRRAALIAPVALLATSFAPAHARAAVVTFGSPLAVPATLNTSENLGYEGVNTQLPGGVVHTFHFGSDTAIWNVAQASGSPSAPATGQALKVKLEGCAKPADGGPAPLNQIHFQSISPLPDGGATVNLTSQPFEIPTCGVNGAGGSTITTYEPINLCVGQGGYIDFNDEGGYVESAYRSGVPYEVLGAVAGSRLDSFIKGGGTNNGATLSPGEHSAMEGFASSQNEELMLQVEEGTGPNATHICPGGAGGLAPPLPPLRVSPQTEGLNSQRITFIAMFCRERPACTGTFSLTYRGKVIGRAALHLRPETTSHAPIRLIRSAYRKIRHSRQGIVTQLTVVVAGQTFTQTVKLI